MFPRVLALAAYASALVDAAPPSLQVPMAVCSLEMHSVQSHSQVNNQVPIWKKLSGSWFDQRGSLLNLNGGEDGTILGGYAVGNTDQGYVCDGWFDASPPPDNGTIVYGVSIGWTLTFLNTMNERNAHATATWSGQFFDDARGQRIVTHWLLSSSTAPDDTWSSTNIGHEVFTRGRPTGPEIAQAQALNIGSPHLEDILAHSQVNKKKINGVWYNQLGSTMNLHVWDDDLGDFSGSYNSTVGKAEDSYGLSGWLDPTPPPDNGLSIGWTLTYRNAELNAHSTATWNGQFFADASSGDRIITQWLLTSSTAPNDSWSSTKIGHDTFTRKKPSAAKIAHARAMTVGSPHMEDILARM